MTALLGIMTVCSTLGSPAVDCIPPRPPIRDMPLLVTWYDPARGGINCGGSCDHLALMPMSDSLYGITAACPMELVGIDQTAVIYHPDIGTRYCLDTGPAVVIEYGLFGGRWQYVVRLDLLENEPHPLNWHLIEGWDYQWTFTDSLVTSLN